MKLWNPRIFTVVGGHHATVSYMDFIESYIDLIVMGEGVFVFKEAISRFEKNSGFDGLPGTAYLKDGKIVMTPPIAVIDLDN
jgi:radical SAM superfamily enzyme YgiQ (UPF0313 family)